MTIFQQSNLARKTLRIREAKKAKLANDVYNEIIETTLLQTRQLLIDNQDGMKVLKEEFNWVVRQKQRLERALRKVQELACFNVLVEGDVADFDTLKSYVCDIASYVETKINKTLDY